MAILASGVSVNWALKAQKLLNDDFKDLDIDLYYKQSERTFDWKVQGGLDYLSNNWYGLSDEIVYSEIAINSIEESQSYTNLYLKGEIEFTDALIHKGDVAFSRFSDKFKSGENHVEINSVIDFPIGQELMYSEISLELLNGKFENDFFQTEKLSYTYFNIGFSPNFEVLRDNLTVNLGARLYYSITNNFEGSKFYFKLSKWKDRRNLLVIIKYTAYDLDTRKCT